MRGGDGQKVRGIDKSLNDEVKMHRHDYQVGQLKRRRGQSVERQQSGKGKNVDFNY